MGRGFAVCAHRQTTEREEARRWPVVPEMTYVSPTPPPPPPNPACEPGMKEEMSCESSGWRGECTAITTINIVKRHQNCQRDRRRSSHTAIKAAVCPCTRNGKRRGECRGR